MRNLRIRALVAVGFFLVGLQLVSGLPAQAAGTSLSVSFPAEPVTVVSGQSISFDLGVDNVGTTPLEATVQERSVTLGNNGQTTLGGSPDSIFGAVTTITPAHMVIAPRSRQDVKVTVRVRKNLSPNDYFLGFLVSPIVPSGSVSAPNDVGAFVVLNVPGPRYMHLTTTVVDLPTVVFSSSVQAIIRVANVGRAVTTFSTDIQITGFVTPTPSLIQKQAQIVPPGHFRDELLKVHSWLGFGIYTFKATFVYALTGTSTGEATAEKTIVLISPFWFAVPAVLVLAVALLIWRHRRSKRTPTPKKRRQHAKR